MPFTWDKKTTTSYNGLQFYCYIITLYQWFSSIIPGWVMELQTDKFACLMVMFLGRSKTHNNYVPQFQFSLICFTRMNFF